MNRVILFLIGIVLVGIAGFAVVWFGVGRELQAPAAKTLVDLRDGKAAEVHAAADASFRERWTVDDLSSYWTWWENELGRFVEILARRDVSTSTKGSETVKTLTLELGFMKRKARAKFEFVSRESGPLLTHMRIYELDEGAGTKDDRGQLVARTRALLRRYDASDWVGLYAAMRFEQQKSWPLSTIREQMSVRRNAQGAVKDVQLANTEEEDNGVVRQHFDVTYEKSAGKLEAVYQFRDGRWHVAGFVMSEAR